MVDNKKSTFESTLGSTPVSTPISESTPESTLGGFPDLGPLAGRRNLKCRTFAREICLKKGRFVFQKSLFKPHL